MKMVLCVLEILLLKILAMNKSKNYPPYSIRKYEALLKK